MRQNRVADARRYAYRRHRHWTASNAKILIIIFTCAWSSGLAGWERLGQFKIRPKSNHLRVTSRLTSCILLNGLTRFNWPNCFCSSLWRNSASSYERMACWCSNKSRFLRLKYSVVDGLKFKPERGLYYSSLYISHIYYSYLSLLARLLLRYRTTVQYQPHILCAQNNGELFLKQ